MAYLHRRIEHLLKAVSEGKVFAVRGRAEEQFRTVLRDLKKVKRDSFGNIDLETCSPTVRSFARTFYLAGKAFESTSEQPKQEKARLSIEKMVEAQRAFFSILSQCFSDIVQCSPFSFDSSETLVKEMKRNATAVADKFVSVLPATSRQLEEFYKGIGTDLFAATRELAGVKLVLGGSQRLNSSTVRSVTSMALYSDTIVVPDPILPWLESERREERFRDMLLMETIYHLLLLKPLVDADLSEPVLVVLPTWERTLGQMDEDTQDGIGGLFLDFFSYYFDRAFQDESEIFQYARSQEPSFLRIVQERQLFFPPGGSGRETLEEGIRLDREMISTWRSREFQAVAARWCDGELVANAIMERLEPQFHLRGNADYLLAEPMLSMKAHWHYFQLLAAMSEGELEKDSRLAPQTRATIRGLSDPSLRWLGNVPIEALVELRARGANAEFRDILKDVFRQLREAPVDDIDRAASEVARELKSLLAGHQASVRRIEEEYQKRHKITAALSWASLAAMFVPWLQPFGMAGGMQAIARYARDKQDEILERRKTSGSVVGVLAAAAVEEDARAS